jgi:hypothetical protein
MGAMSVLFLVAACVDYELNDPADEGPVLVWDTGWSDEPTDGAANLQVLPDPFDFGTVARDCRSFQFDWVVRNVGDSEVTVSAFSLDGATSEVLFDVPGLPFTLQPGEMAWGLATYTPTVDGGPTGTFRVFSDDPDAPEIQRPLQGESCGDKDSDWICDADDADRDGDGLANDVDLFPDHVIVDDAHVDFDELTVGTRVQEQYADLGVHFIGAGNPGEGYDSNVIQQGPTCTTAVLSSSPNVLCTYVNDGFNNAGDPGLSGWLDTEADAVTVRMYTAGMAYSETHGQDRDQATLITYNHEGQQIGTHTAMADTDDGIDYVDLVVLGPGAMAFDLFTGDFDALDDLHVLRLEEPVCVP